MRNEAEAIAERCVRATRTERLSRRARDVALVAVMLAPEGEDSTYAHRVIEEYRRRNPQLNPFFVAFVLPILASLIARWIERWILNRRHGISRLRAEAFDAIDSSP
jgi:hypothetical protein